MNLIGLITERDLRMAAIIIGGIGMIFTAYFSIDTVAQGAMGLLIGFGAGAGFRRAIDRVRGRD
jgi:hypothetical protein